MDKADMALTMTGSGRKKRHAEAQSQSSPPYDLHNEPLQTHIIHCSTPIQDCYHVSYNNIQDCLFIKHYQ